jgi:Flp pilus assembly protein TadB
MADKTPQGTGKGRPTPTRKEREAERKRPIVLDRKADLAKRRTDRRAKADREYQAMLSGDERNMPAQHAGAPRRFARDFIDSRTTIAEFLLLICLAAVIFISFTSSPEVVSIVGVTFTVTMIAAALECWLLIRRLKRRAVEKYGEERLPRFYRIYCLTRMLQVRRLRMPKPQVRRGEFPT